VTRRLLVLSEHRHLAVVVTGDHRGIKVVRGRHLVVEGLHGLVVGLGIAQIVVGSRKHD
jgi:hypothetical protein